MSGADIDSSRNPAESCFDQRGAEVKSPLVLGRRQWALRREDLAEFLETEPVHVDGDGKGDAGVCLPKKIPHLLGVRSRLRPLRGGGGGGGGGGRGGGGRGGLSRLRGLSRLSLLNRLLRRSDQSSTSSSPYPASPVRRALLRGLEADSTGGRVRGRDGGTATADPRTTSRR